MASQVVGSPCHLLRMPYELHQLILGELSQKDQIRISRTCVTLYELAYPLAYNRISVKISPARRDSTWRHLASGVCLRYVRHFELQSLYEGEKKPRSIEDLVAGTIIASLRRCQLRSFSLKVPVSTKTAISIKNVVILMKTQPLLEQLNLPGINGSPLFLIRNRALTDVEAYSLQNITLFMPSTNPFREYLSQIARNCSNVKHFHLHFCALIDEDPGHLWDSIVDTIPKLCSMATKLTLREYNLLRCSLRGHRRLTLPNLKALALIDCNYEYCFYDKLDPKFSVNLTALMIKSTNYIDTDRLNTFIRPMKCLCELIVHTRSYFSNLSGFVQQMHSLKLLSLAHPTGNTVFSASDMRKELSNVPPTTQHLSLGIGYVGIGLPSIACFNCFSDYMDIFAGSTNLKTFNLRCTTYVANAQSGLTARELKQIDHGALFEPLIIRTAIQQLGGTTIMPGDFPALEAMSVQTCCSFFPNQIPSDVHHLASGVSQSHKIIFSLKPELKPRPAAELKEVMKQRYAKDGYHFMEDYIDGMMEPSSSRLLRLT